MAFFFHMNQRIYNYSLHLLARQDYSEYKLKKKLLSKPDNTIEEVNEVIEKLLEKKLLNEENYKRLFIKKWIYKGESFSKISMRGKAEKLEIFLEDFQAIEEEMGIKEEDSLESLIHKKLRSKVIPNEFPQRQKLKEKVLRFLISKGHDYSDAKDGIEKYFKNGKAED